MAKKATTDNIVCRNRRAGHRFHVVEKIECGVVLSGTEVKSLRQRNASIEEAYARIDDGELFLIGCHISPYKFGTMNEHDPLRRRKLLARAAQIGKLKQKVEQKGFTLVPLSIYFNNRGIAKVTIGLVRSKNVADKRRALQERDSKREIDRAMHRRR